MKKQIKTHITITSFILKQAALERSSASLHVPQWG